MAMEVAREAGQREQLALVGEESKRKKEAIAEKGAEGGASKPEIALREEDNRRREGAMAKAKEARAKAIKKGDAQKKSREAREAREAAERERLALIEEENRHKEEALAMEIAARETREREAAIRQEENRRREEAMAKAKEAKERAAKEAREARIREQALKREAKRRETEARIARERAEREAREAAERRRQLEIAAQREKEAAVVEQYVVSETSLVTCSAGFNIQHVIPGFDLCRIVIKNLPKNAKREEIVDIFIQQGIQSSEFLIFQLKEIGSKQEAVVLANAEHGEAISLGLDGIEFREEVLTFSVSDNASWNALGTAGQSIPFVIVSWTIPAETIVVNYYSMEEAQRKMRELDKKIWKGRRINAKMDRPRQGGRNFVPESVTLFNCPPGSEMNEEFHQLVGSHDVRLLNSSALFDLEESFNLIHRRISGLWGVRINTYQVLKQGDQADGEAKVKVEFDDWEDAKRAHLAIDKQRIGFATPCYRCWLPKQLQYKITIPRQQYESQKKHWDALGERKGVDDPYVQARMGDRGGVFIEIVGKEKETAGPLKVRVENMIAGEKLDPTFWHPSFAAPKSKAFFDRIYAEKKVFVRSDFKTRSLKIYGESNAVEEARHMIQGRIESLGQIETTRMLNREWVGYFVREGVGKLTELLGEENVRLDVQPRMCRITIKGGEEANHFLNGSSIKPEQQSSSTLSSLV
jgi:RNA recognition motif-containing protein